MSAARYLKRLERDKPGAGHAAAQAASNENFCLVGTPLPSLVDSKKDRNEYQPVWQQEVLDEQGRRRFHGAFTGGFSAGYFNTVGSKQGWAPSTWKSGRDNKRSRPEDFMDEEDLEAVKEARVLETKPEYDLLAGEDVNKRRRLDDSSSSSFANIFRPAKGGIGTLLMRKMGWRDGQGVGPRITVHQAKAQDPNLNVLVEHGNKHSFPPKDTVLMNPPRQIATQGLGYAYTAHSLRSSQPTDSQSQPRAEISHGFGLGIEDADEDDMDVYGGPSASIERGRKLNQLAYDDGQNSSIASKQPRRQQPKQDSPKNLVGVEFFKDGKPNLKGFELQKKQQQDDTWFSQPDVPKDWKPDPLRVLKITSHSNNGAQESRPIASDANDRARILGEEVPKRSVFDYISAADTQRLVKEQSDFEDEQEVRVPAIDKATANNALRAHIPFPDGDTKRNRYTAYLHSQSDPQKFPPDIVNLPADAQTKTQFNIELAEFQKVASLYKPMTAAMAGRFTTGSRTSVASETPSFEPGLRPGVAPKPKEATPPPKPVEEVRAERDAERIRNETPLQRAVREGNMGIKYGTHTFTPWKPSKLLCRRFQVPPPAITLESDDTEAGFQFGKQTGAEAPSTQDAWAAAGLQPSMPAPPNVKEMETRHAAVTERDSATSQVGLGVDEKTMEEIAKQQRPSMDVFKAIFDDSDEDDDTDAPKAENKAEPQKTSQKKKKKDAKKRSSALNKLTFDDGGDEQLASKPKPKRQTAADYM